MESTPGLPPPPPRFARLLVGSIQVPDLASKTGNNVFSFFFSTTTRDVDLILTADGRWPLPPDVVIVPGYAPKIDAAVARRESFLPPDLDEDDGRVNESS